MRKLLLITLLAIIFVGCNKEKKDNDKCYTCRWVDQNGLNEKLIKDTCAKTITKDKDYFVSKGYTCREI
jgi:hypothetical protein